MSYSYKLKIWRVLSLIVVLDVMTFVDRQEYEYRNAVYIIINDLKINNGTTYKTCQLLSKKCLENENCKKEKINLNIQNA